MTWALDTSLMAMFLLRKYDDNLYIDFRSESMKDLSNILDMIQEGKFHDARYKWMMHCQSIAKIPLGTMEIITHDDGS